MNMTNEPLNTEQLFSRTKQKRWLLIKRQAVVLGIALILGLAWFFKLNEPAELSALDAWSSRPQISQNSSTVLLTISEKSIAQIGKWPWPSFQYAVILELLQRFGARSIYLEGDFADAETAEEQAPLITVLEKKKIPIFFSADYTARFENVGPGLAALGLDSQPKEGWARPVAEIAKRAFLSHRLIYPDRDRVFRFWEPWVEHEHQTYPLAALKMRMETKADFERDALIQVQETEHQLISWNQTSLKKWPRVEFADLMQSYLAMREGMRPTVDPKIFDGKDIFIGLTHEHYAPAGLTPWKQRIFPVEVMAAIYDGLQNPGQLIRTVAPRWSGAVLFAVLALMLIVWTGWMLGTVYWLGCAGFVLLIGAAWFAFFIFGVWYPFVTSTLFLAISAAAVFIFDALHAKQERSALFHLATRDGLTNLYVIRHFRVIMNQMTREAVMRKEQIAVILMDIDHFKKINDTHGHPAGDMVLKKTAERIQSAVRHKRTLKEIDFVARYGGEEFIILIRRNSLENTATKIAERVRSLVQATDYDWNGTKISVTVSLGVATLNAGENIPDPMVHRADKALYLAKQSGRNRVCTEKELNGNK